MRERRGERRSSFYRTTEIVVTGSGRRFNLLRANIGFSGIGGYTPDLVGAGSEVVVRIDFPKRSGEVVTEEIPGKVAWAQQDGNFNAVGIAFHGLDRNAHPLLFSYLQYLDQFD